MKHRDLRRKPRIALNSRPRISWQDRYGQTRMACVKLLDICEHGMRIEMPAPLEPKALVGIRDDSIKLSGSASVRHCRRMGSKYHVGLEFLGGLVWRPPANPVQQSGLPVPPPAPAPDLTESPQR